MVRNILAVIASFVVIYAIVIAGNAVAYTVLGPDRVYHPGVWDITLLWGATMLVIGLVAALVAGFSCAKIARNRKGAVLTLAAVIAVLGLAQLGLVLAAPEPEDPVRPDDFTMEQAMTNARQPVWFALVNPIVAVSGILIGANVAARGHKSES
jgi:membrane associated rhomboid family serine protease